MEKKLTQGNEYFTIMQFVLPILLGNIFQQLYNVADSIVVGRLLGKDALAAVGASFGISSIILAAAMGLTLGYSILISGLYGSGAYDKIQDTIDTGMIVAGISAAAITLLGIFKGEMLLELFHIPAQIKKDVFIYFKIILIGTVPLFGYNSITNFLRGLGDSRTPLYFLVIASIINVLLDILLVKAFSMGVAGAAAATVIAQFLSFFALVIYVNRNMNYKIRCRQLKFVGRIFRDGLRIGIPAMLQQIFLGFGSSVIQVLINGYGVIAISAYTAASKIDGFAVMPAVNIGKAMTNYVAQNIGAGEAKRVERGIKAGFALVTAVSIGMTAFVLIRPNGLVKLFCSDKAVCTAGSEYLRIVGMFYMIFGAMQLLNGILIGKGNSFFTLMSTVCSFCLLQVPAAIILSKLIGVRGIWIAAPIGWIGGFLMRFIYYKRSLSKGS